MLLPSSYDFLDHFLAGRDKPACLPLRIPLTIKVTHTESTVGLELRRHKLILGCILYQEKPCVAKTTGRVKSQMRMEHILSVPRHWGTAVSSSRLFSYKGQIACQAGFSIVGRIIALKSLLTLPWPPGSSHLLSNIVLSNWGGGALQ